MISLNYSKSVVRWFLLKDNNGNLDPTAEDLQATDVQLKDTFETILNDILPDFPLELNKRVKSQVVLLSVVSQGGTTRSRVRNACRCLVNTKDL